jgi:hypothetical protein
MIFECDLREDDDADDGTPPWLTDDKFLYKYSSFYRLLSLIENHPAFVSNGCRSRHQSNTNYFSTYSTLKIW